MSFDDDDGVEAIVDGVEAIVDGVEAIVDKNINHNSTQIQKNKNLLHSGRYMKL